MEVPRVLFNELAKEERREGKEKERERKQTCVFSQLLLAISKRYGRRLDPKFLPETRLDLFNHLRKKNQVGQKCANCGNFNWTIHLSSI